MNNVNSSKWLWFSLTGLGLLLLGAIGIVLIMYNELKFQINSISQTGFVILAVLALGLMFWIAFMFHQFAKQIAEYQHFQNMERIKNNIQTLPDEVRFLILEKNTQAFLADLIKHAQFEKMVTEIVEKNVKPNQEKTTSEQTS